MGNYEISVMGKETYFIYGAENKTKAIQEAIEYFQNDDLFVGSREAEHVTEDDCEVVWFEKC